jgi:hypothetical protein
VDPHARKGARHAERSKFERDDESAKGGEKGESRGGCELRQ